MSARRAAVVMVGALSLAACVAAEQPVAQVQTGFLDRTITVDGIEARYQLYVPREYDGATEWPVILFLHGAGERGSDGLLQTQVGLGRSIRTDVERWPAVVVMPQVPEDQTWTGWAGGVAMAALDATVAELSIDGSRIYLTGMSMGGQGSWYLAYEHPERWAAVAPICSFLGFDADPWRHFVPEGVDPATAVAERVAHIPVWVFHGDADQAVPVEASRAMVAALEAAGADVRYTEFPGVNHNAWDPAYEMEELTAWMFSRRR